MHAHPCSSIRGAQPIRFSQGVEFEGSSSPITEPHDYRRLRRPLSIAPYGKSFYIKRYPWDDAPRFPEIIFIGEEEKARRLSMLENYPTNRHPTCCPPAGTIRPSVGRGPRGNRPFGSDRLHFVSASHAVELVSLGKDVRRATYLEPALLGAAWFVCILPCSIISASVLNLAPQVLHLYFFPNNPISSYHLPREHM